MTSLSQDIREALRYPFSDPQAFLKLFLQGGFLFCSSFFLIGWPFFLGYGVLCTKKGMEGKNGKEGLPHWNEWKSFWDFGWKLSLHECFYLMLFTPLFFLLGIFALVVGTGGFLAGGVLDTLIAILLISSWTFVFFLFIPFQFFLFVYNTSSKLPFFKALALFDRSLWRYLMVNAKDIFLLSVFISFLWLMAFLVGTMAFGIGVLFTVPYALAVSSYLIGLVHRKTAPSNRLI